MGVYVLVCVYHVYEYVYACMFANVFESVCMCVSLYMLKCMQT